MVDPYGVIATFTARSDNKKQQCQAMLLKQGVGQIRRRDGIRSGMIRGVCTTKVFTLELCDEL